MKGTPWKRLTRADLKGCFDDIGTDVILTAMEHGATGRVSARGHATIRHPDGERTMSVTRSSSSRRAQNMWGDLRRLFPDGNQIGTTKDDSDMHNDPQDPPLIDIELPKATNGLSALPPADDPLKPCPAKKCDREFATEGALYRHVADEHVVCDWPGCTLGPDGAAFVGDTRASINGHISIQHKGIRPWEHRDPSKRSATARKSAATRAAKARGASTTEQVAETAPPAPVAKAEPRKQQNAPEHRGLPSVSDKPMSDKAKLRAIREILGEDPRVTKLQAQVAELQAHLDLVREAVGLDDQKKNK